MELKTPMVFVKHIIAAQRGNAQSIQFLCERTSGQFVKICRKYDLSNSEIEAVLAKAYGTIFADIQSVRNPQTFMSWAGKIVEDCCIEIAGPRGKAPEPAAPEPAVMEPKAKVPVETGKTGPKPAAPIPEAVTGVAATVSAAAAGVSAAEKAVETAAEPIKESPGETGQKPAAFYDENAYVQPSGTYNAEVNYADEAREEAKPADNRIIPVDELVYHPEVGAISSGEPSAPVDVRPPITPDPSVYASIPTFASSYEEEAVFQDTYPAAADRPAYAESKAAGDSPAYAESRAAAEKPAYEESKTAGSFAEPPAVSSENVSAATAETVPAAAQEDSSTADAATNNASDDEPDIDLYEKEESEKAQDDADVEVNDSDYDENDEDEDDEDDEELESGLAFRTKVLIGLLCVFIFGACVGIGYAISKGMTGSEPTSSEPGVVETQADTIDESESLVDSLIESVMESLLDSSAAEPESSRETADTAGSNTTDTEGAGNQTPESVSTDTAENQNTESQAADPSSAAGGEVTARADIATYLGGTFASVFRDYPDIPRSVYRGELSLADAHIGFIGSYDATQPVSSTVVESVSLLGEGGNYNINGFYVGMTAEDAESLAAAGGYSALEMTAESSREYADSNNNTLSLTIDGGKVKSVTLRSPSSDHVAMEAADEVTDEVTEEVPEEIPGEEGGVG